MTFATGYVGQCVSVKIFTYKLIDNLFCICWSKAAMISFESSMSLNIPNNLIRAFYRNPFIN